MLAHQVDENLRLFRVLCSEMKDFVENIESILGRTQAAMEASSPQSGSPEDGVDGTGFASEWIATAQSNIVVASISDGLRKHLTLLVSPGEILCLAVCFLGLCVCRWHLRCALQVVASTKTTQRHFCFQEKVAGALSVVTPSEEVEAYLTILRVQPYLNDAGA